MLPWKRCLAPSGPFHRQVLSFIRFRSGPATQVSSDSSQTELEKKEDLFQRQRILANSTVRIKSYAAGHLRPGSTHFKKPVHDHLHKGRPIQALTTPKKKTAGRNHTGQITIRGRGGGHRRRVRLIDAHRMTPGKHTVLRLEYDPNRSGHIALIKSPYDCLLYILAPLGLREGDQVESFRAGLPADFLKQMEETNNGEIDDALLTSRIMQRGNCLPLRMIPVGSIIHGIGLTPNGRAQLVRSAGTFARLLTKHVDQKKVVVKLCSGEHRYIHIDCPATLGVVSNKEHKAISWGKAGRSRHRGFRPMVRGVAMNAHDHPHGGGRGKSKSNKVSQSMWGIKKFARTRKFKNVNKNKVVDRRDA